MMPHAVALAAACVACTALAVVAGRPAAAQSARTAAPVDLTGYWVSVVTEDWPWRMHTPPKGDYASIPLTDEGRRVADLWTEAQDGSCLAFGAAAVLRMPTRVRITWQDDSTLKLETDNGQQTRLFRFGRAAASASGPPSLQGTSLAEWQQSEVVRARGSEGGETSARVDDGAWTPLKVTTTNLTAAWLRPNGVPVGENAVVTEYFDYFTEGEQEWLVVTTMVDDPQHLSERLVISSNFRREPGDAQWAPRPCQG
jgi:hypothetical protein